MKFIIYFLLAILFCQMFSVKIQNLSGIGSKLKNRVRVSSRHRTKLNSHSLSKGKLQFASNNQISNSLEDSTSKDLKPRRRTEDGRICASQFSLYGKTYTECTTDMNPDGELQTDKEWCYVEGSKEWAYCSPILDYDSVRERSMKLWKKMAVIGRQAVDMISADVHPILKTVDEVHLVREKTQNIDLRLQKSTEQLTMINNNEALMNKFKDGWIKLNNDIAKLKNILQQLEAQAATSVDNDPCNCAGMYGYESEGLGEGIIGEYYDNAEFSGDAKTKMDLGIDFYVNNDAPMEGINFENFSIVWKGWLRVPKDQSYIFSVSCDGGCWFEINTQIVVQDFVGELRDWGLGNDEIKEEKEDRIKRIQEGRMVESRPIDLKGGEKYYITYKMVKSSHNKQENDKISFAQLWWASSEMERTLVKTNFFYEKNLTPPPKIIEYDSSKAELTSLEENMNAFLDEQKWKVQDIPLRFQGLPFLRFQRGYAKKELNLELSGDLTLLIAVEALDDDWYNPLDQDWIDTNELITILTMPAIYKPKIFGQSEIRDKVVATENHRYKVFKKKHEGGDQLIKFKLTTEYVAVNFLLFVTSDPKAKPLSCGGDEIQLSLPLGKPWKGCKQSSKQEGQGWDCESAFSGKEVDSQAGMWASYKQGMGAWIELELSNTYLVTRFEYMQRQQDNERVSEIKFIFDSLNEEVFEVKNLPTLQEFTLSNPRMAEKVRLTFSQVYTSGNNGGAFNIYGVPCTTGEVKDETPGAISAKEKEFKDKVFRLKCFDTYESNEELQFSGLQPGDTVTMKCDEDCLKYEEYDITGKYIYTQDSSICRAAIHSEALLQHTGQFKMTIVKCPDTFDSIEINGIFSQSKQGCDNSWDVAIKPSLLLKDIESLNIFKIGNKVDILDGTTKKWLEGYIKDLKRPEPEQLEIVAGMQGQDREFVIKYPSPTLGYCGEYILDRQCDEHEADPKQSEGVTKWSFGMEPIKEFILDKGRMFADQDDKGLVYGWNIASQARIRKRNANGNPLLDNLILFAPDQNSHWCTQPPKLDQKPYDCTPTSWSAEVEKGFYDVEITVGDSEIMARYDMQVNGVEAIGRWLKPNDYYTIKLHKVNALEGTIQLTALCPQKSQGDPSFCKYSWTRISALKIKKLEIVQEDEDDVEIKDLTEKLGCGEAYRKGRCDTSDQIENCVYESIHDPALKHCTGRLMVYRIGHNYMCDRQRGMVKCAREKFELQSECNEYCPGTCVNKVCHTIPIF